MKPTKITMLLLLVAMIAMAMLDNVRGVFVPSFKLVYGIQNTGIGWMLLISSLCYMAGTYAAGYLIKATQQKTVLIGGATLTATGVVLIILSTNVFGLFTGMIVINTGIGAMGLSINTVIPLLKVKNPAVLMNFVHFLYGVGATITQKSAGALLSLNWSFKAIYLIIVGVFVALIIIATQAKLPQESHSDKQKEHFTKGQMKVLLVLSLALGLYIAGELQTANWLVNYLKVTFLVNENVASNFSATFFLVFSIGRLLGGYAVNKIGYMKSVYTSITIASVLYVVGLSSGLNGGWVIAFSGIFFSIAYPTVMLVIGTYIKRGVTQAAGIIITLSAGVNMLMGLLIGVAADFFSIRVAMYIMPTSLFVSAMLFYWVYRRAQLWIDAE
jgi:fucose permease